MVETYCGEEFLLNNCCLILKLIHVCVLHSIHTHYLKIEEIWLTLLGPCWVCTGAWGCEGSSCATWFPWAKLTCPGKVILFGNSLATWSRVVKENGESPGIWACCCCRIPEKGGIHELKGLWNDIKEKEEGFLFHFRNHWKSVLSK